MAVAVHRVVLFFVLLLGFGCIMVYSATINDSTLTTGDGTARLKTHLVHVALGIGVLVFGTFFPYRNWRRLVYPALLATVVLRSRNAHYRRLHAVETRDDDGDGVPDVYQEGDHRRDG